MLRCRDLALICHFFGLGGSHLKAMGPIYGSHPIGLLYFLGPWTLDPKCCWPKCECAQLIFPMNLVYFRVYAFNLGGDKYI
jgi:hypothetical protein